MKTNLILFSLLFLVSCGQRLLIENEYNDKELKDRVTALESKVKSLEDSRLLMIQDITNNQADIDELKLSGENGEALISDLQAELDSLQNSVNLASSQIVALQQNANISSLIDPCGDGAGFDEVLFRLSDGRIVGSFSENVYGLNTRFSVLTAGNYQTTDNTGCRFTVNANGSLTW
jgi:hypothetical protein